MTKAVIYLRVSSDIQAEADRYGLEAQRQTCTARLLKHPGILNIPPFLVMHSNSPRISTPSTFPVAKRT